MNGGARLLRAGGDGVHPKVAADLYRSMGPNWLKEIPPEVRTLILGIQAT